MKVSIKDLSVSMELGNKGITFDVYDNNKFLGDLRIAKGTIEWCKGKVKAGNGIHIKWPELIKFFEEKSKTPKKKAAKKSTKVAAKTGSKNSKSK